MTTNPTTHTAAQLAALAPRELDAIAAPLIASRIVSRSSPDGMEILQTDQYGGRWVLFTPSTDLNHAALLEAELARRGQPHTCTATLLGILDSSWRVFEDWASIERLEMVATASAKDRTIAAVLAAQESPYVQIVTWNKHPKDSANSQSAHDSPAA